MTKATYEKQHSIWGTCLNFTGLVHGQDAGDGGGSKEVWHHPGEVATAAHSYPQVASRKQGTLGGPGMGF